MSGVGELSPHAGPRPPRNWTKAAVGPATVEGRRVARKSVDERWWRRFGPAGWLLRREARVLTALQGLACTPRVVSSDSGRIDVAWEDGEHLKERVLGITEAEASAARRALDELHAAGWGHGDIGPRDIIVRPDGCVVLLDFATALGPSHPPLVGRFAARYWQRRDRRRLERLLRRCRRRYGVAVPPVEDNPA